eukprot:NODE_54_length_26799_cov_0.554794.p6 type:complete len:349 gc:universal NODE_54_length_26799_cov_0.554794:17473-16427(-)
MLKYFPYSKMVFVSNSQCLTNAPDKWSILKSQRRRWINSTVHNLAELIWIDSLCGFCCFSMRFIVFIDLISTVVGPIGVVYLMYLISRIIYDYVFGTPGLFPVISFILLAAIYGLQALIFIIKRDFQHIGWMLIYIIAIPVFNLMLPVYSFWHFDDFSWGTTRVILGEGGKQQIISKQVDTFDINQIPHKTWQEYSNEVNELLQQRPQLFKHSREASWFVDAPADVQNVTNSNPRMSTMYSPFVAASPRQDTPRMSMYSSPMMASPMLGDQLRANPSPRASMVRKRQPYVSDEVGAIPDDRLIESIRMFMREGEMSKKKILMMLESEYNREMNKTHVYELIDNEQQNI